MKQTIIYIIIVIILGYWVLKWADMNDKAQETYWTSKLEECRARGTNFDLQGGICVQSTIY